MTNPASFPSGSPVTLMCETASIDPSQAVTVWFRGYKKEDIAPQYLVSFQCTY